MPRRILIVDDEPSNLLLLEAILESPEYELLQATNGAEALAVLEREKIDLVLLDVMMPVMDGIDALRTIRARPEWLGLPVIIVTAATDRGSRLRGFDAGADEFLEKPIDTGLLRMRVRNLLHLRECREQLLERARAIEELNQERHELVNLIVHDLKNPLSVIHTNLRYMHSQLPAGLDAVLEPLEDAETASERMKGLILDILSVEQMDRAELRIRRQEVNVPALVEEVARAHRREAELQNLDLKMHFAEGVGTIRADGDLIRRVVENLVENALHHTPAHGQIELRAENGTEFAFVVSNTGQPIPECVRDSLFQKFTRGNGNSRGRFGLGLYFCHRVAMAHNGSIALIQRDGWPVTFRFAVPTA